jgi:spore coat-associated protein N
MNRVTALWRSSPRAFLLGVGTIGLAAAVTVGSGADFTSTTANPSNIFTAGTLSHSNSKDGLAILTAGNMRPGDTATGTVVIQNTGSLSGAFSLTKNVTVDSVPVSFATKLTVVISDGAVPIYSGTVAGMGTIALGTFAAGATHTYTFVVTFPDSGPNGADNAYQGKSTTVTYDWTAAS